MQKVGLFNAKMLKGFQEYQEVGSETSSQSI